MLSINYTGKASRLTQRRLNNPAKNLDYSKLPKEIGLFRDSIATYDYFSGSGKKGRFKSYIIKDIYGTDFLHYTRYFEDDDSAKDIITTISNLGYLFDISRTTRKTDLKNQKEISEPKIESISLLKDTTKPTWKKMLVVQSKDGDFGIIEYLKAKTKPVGIKFNFNWNGPSEIECKNTQGQKPNLSNQDKIALPFVIGDMLEDPLPNRKQEKINLAQKYFENLYGIKGLLPQAKADQDNEIYGGLSEDEFLDLYGFIPAASCKDDGQIFIGEVESSEFFSTIAHEMKHANDFILFYRSPQAIEEAKDKLGKPEFHFEPSDSAKKFIEKVRSKGLITKEDKKYDECLKIAQATIKSQDKKHDKQPMEKRARKAEQKANGYLTRLTMKIIKFLDKFSN